MGDYIINLNKYLKIRNVRDITAILDLFTNPNEDIKELYELGDKKSLLKILDDDRYVLRLGIEVYEDNINKNFSELKLSYNNSAVKPLNIEDNIRVHALNKQITTKSIMNDFPSSNWLFHSTYVAQAIEILKHGELVNTKKLESYFKINGNNVKVVNNSGYEGISFSFNKIWALPGDDYHLVGFLTSPESILDENMQLTIPSRPSRYEVILINKHINPVDYYYLKTQKELYDSMSVFGEINSVISTIFEVVVNQSDIFSRFIKAEIWKSKGVSMEKYLRQFFKIRPNKTIELSPKLFGQVDDTVSVAAVWFQALIDAGRINSMCRQQTCTVVDVMNKISKKTFITFIKEADKDLKYISDLIDKRYKNYITPITLPIENFYLVVPKSDLNKYTHLISKFKHYPKGILVYNDNIIRFSNFTDHFWHGDHEKLTIEIIKTIHPNVPKGYIDYNNLLGLEINEEMIRGYKQHIIGEQFLGNRKSITLSKTGRPVIVEW